MFKRIWDCEHTYFECLEVLISVRRTHMLMYTNAQQPCSTNRASHCSRQDVRWLWLSPPTGTTHALPSSSPLEWVGPVTCIWPIDYSNDYGIYMITCMWLHYLRLECPSCWENLSLVALKRQVDLKTASWKKPHSKELKIISSQQPARN